MTATDPRPALAAALAARLAPAAEALATAYARDADPEPPPPDDRARAECHRAARAQLDHLRKLLALLDWAGAHLPEPTAPEPEEEPWQPPPAIESDYDGSEDEFHFRSEVYVGSQKTPEFRAWYAEQERRFGPLVPDEDDYDGSEDESHWGDRKYVGRLDTPEYSAWCERQDRRDAEEEREEEEAEARTAQARTGGHGDGREDAAAADHDIPQEGPAARRTTVTPALPAPREGGGAWDHP